MKKIINSISGVIFGAGMLAAFLGMAAADGNSNAAFIMIFAGLGIAVVSSYIMEVTGNDSNEFN